MKFSLTAYLLILLSGCSTFDKVEDRAHIKWNYKHSSDVIHALLIENTNSTTNNDECNVRYSKFKVIESFKGELKEGEIFNATGISTHECRVKGTEQFLMLKPFVATDFPGYGNCLNVDYLSFLTIHNWCCSINSIKQRSFVMYDMLTSEQSGERYLVPVSDTFQALRKIQNSSNKAIQTTSKTSDD